MTDARLFHWRDECEPVRQGLNLYPLNTPYHLGGYLRIGRVQLYVRWSKKTRRLFWRFERVTPAEFPA